MAGDRTDRSSSPRPSLHMTVAGEGGSTAPFGLNPAEMRANEEILVDAVLPSSSAEHGASWTPAPPRRRVKRRGRTFTRTLKNGKNAKSPVPAQPTVQVPQTESSSSEVDPGQNGPDTSGWSMAQLKRRVRDDHRMKEKYRTKIEHLESTIEATKLKLEDKVALLTSLQVEMRQDKKAVNKVSVHSVH